jgi:hypothetical protein
MSKLFAPAVVALAFALSFAPPALADKGSSGGAKTELRAEGTVSAVKAAAGTISIRTQSGAVVTVSTTAATKVERNGVTVKLSAFKVGDRGQVRYAAGGVASKVEASGP